MARHPHGEARVRMAGPSAGELLHVVYIKRGAMTAIPTRHANRKEACPVALIRMTLKDIKPQAVAQSPEEQAAFQHRMLSTREAQIHRQMIEDGEDLAAEPHFAPPVLAQDVRKEPGLTQAAFPDLLGIPVTTLRNWEQNRFIMERAVKTLLKLINCEPEAALRALGGPQAA